MANNYESEMRRKIIEKQMELWQMQARMGQQPDIKRDMEKIYGLDKIQQKRETKDIVKSAVIGGIIAGPAGAVVGAAVEKNKIDNNRFNERLVYPSNYQNNQRNFYAEQSSYGYGAAINTHSGIYDSEDAVEKIKEIYLDGERREPIGEMTVTAILSALTGDEKHDVLVCVNALQVAKVSDILIILSNHPNYEMLSVPRTSSYLRSLKEDGLVEKIEVERITFYCATENAADFLLSSSCISGAQKPILPLWYTTKSYKLAEEFVKQNSLELSSAGFAKKTKMQTDSLELDRYLQNIFLLEADIFELTRELSMVYIQRDKIIALERARLYSDRENAKIKQNEYQKKINDAKKNYAQYVKTLKALKNAGPGVPVPPKVYFPKPTPPALREPGLFNKKKVLEENAKATATYENALRLHNTEAAEIAKEIERQKNKNLEDHIKNISKAEADLSAARKKLDELEANKPSFNVKSDKTNLETAMSHMIGNEIAKTEENIKSLCNLRDKYYGLEIVFGKYRNIIPIASFAEYVMTGRCSSLDGADGAYNLYEAEARSNTIISQMSDAIVSLDRLENNQYSLYWALTGINAEMEALGVAMDQAYSAVVDIATESTDFDALLGEIFADEDVSAYNQKLGVLHSKIETDIAEATEYINTIKGE